MYKEKDDAYGTLVRLNKVDYPDTVVITVSFCLLKYSDTGSRVFDNGH